MMHFLHLLRDHLLHRQPQPVSEDTVFGVERRELQVTVPNLVVLPLSRAQRDEMIIPASINGRDLSKGRP